MSSKLCGFVPGHVPAVRYASYDRARFDSFFKFAFVRNPWSRLFSAYHHLKQKVGRNRSDDDIWASQYLAGELDFEGFVLALRRRWYRVRVLAYPHFRRQVWWVRLPGSSRVALDFVGRFEHLQEDFATIAERLGVDPALGWLKRGKVGDYRAAYTAQMQDIVRDIYAEDIKAFGYQEF